MFLHSFWKIFRLQNILAVFLFLFIVLCESDTFGVCHIPTYVHENRFKVKLLEELFCFAFFSINLANHNNKNRTKEMLFETNTNYYIKIIIISIFVYEINKSEHLSTIHIQFVCLYCFICYRDVHWHKIPTLRLSGGNKLTSFWFCFMIIIMFLRK